MRHFFRLILLCACGSLLLLTGCATGRLVSAGKPYHVTAYRPSDPSKVRVLVSLSKENVYVMEGGWSGEQTYTARQFQHLQKRGTKALRRVWL